MSRLFTDIGYKSINHFGEQLCGDHVDVVDNEKGKVVVLADGLKSGVKASILSTLTSKIISTMMSSGMSIQDCVSAISTALPIDKEYGVAYSTFTIMNIIGDEAMELIQYDNPLLIMIRDGEVYDYKMTEMLIGGKKIYRSMIFFEPGDVFVAMSDGCPNAGPNNSINANWQRKDIADFMKMIAPIGYTAKTLSTMLVDECNRLYEGVPVDDVTSCVIKIRERSSVNMVFGSPADKNDDERMMNLFMARSGMHVVCGGTTASIAARYLGKDIEIDPGFDKNSDIPPTSLIDGLDLVTEGIVTINRVYEYARDYIGDNERYEEWCYKKDGAAQLSRLLFEEATDITMFVGRAVNPAHQADASVDGKAINFALKMQLAQELAECLKKMRKNVKVIYF